MYKNKKDIFYILKKQIKHTSTCAVLSVGNPNQQMFFVLFRAFYAKFPPPNSSHNFRLQATLQKT